MDTPLVFKNTDLHGLEPSFLLRENCGAMNWPRHANTAGYQKTRIRNREGDFNSMS